MRIIILGSTGFIGSSLVKYFKSCSIKLVEINSAIIDLRDTDAHKFLINILQPEDIVILLACITPDRQYQYSLRANLEIGRQVSLAIQVIKPRHFIYFSSDAVYAPSYEKIHEYSKLSHITEYAQMHLVREQMFRKINGLNLSILRPTMVFGKNNTHDIYSPDSLIKQAMLSRRINLFGLGDDTKDFIYIDDLVSLTHQIIKDSHVGIYNLASGFSVTYLNLALEIVKNIKNNIVIDYIERNRPIYVRHFNIDKLNSLKYLPTHPYEAIHNIIKEY